MSIEILLIIFLVTIFCELIDSAFGMMYGTILSPFLIFMGIEPTIIIPGILLSQALGGTIAAYRHKSFKNITFKKNEKELKIITIIFLMGLFSVILGTFVAINIPKSILTMYIGILVTIMGLIVIINKQFNFKWSKIYLIGFLSSFNKALSGGGFGPVVSTGMIASGNEPNKSVAITDTAEVPICLSAFITWLIFNTIPLNWIFIAVLCLGAIIGAYFGPYLLSKIKSKNIVKQIIGLLAIILGILCIFGAKI